jgi:hypothetical protein
MHFVLSVYDHVQDHVDADVVLDVEGFLFIANFNKFNVWSPMQKLTPE